MKRSGVFFVFILLMSVELLATPGKKQLTIRFRDTSNGLYDITHIYLDMGRSPLFNPTVPPPPQPEDAGKQLDTAISMPQIYSFSSDNVACYSNGYGPFDSTTVVRLGIRVEGGHSYTFSAQLVDNFDPTTIILIEDRQNGVFQDLRQSEFSVFLGQAQTTENRFFIHISYPPVIDLTPSGCSNDDGIISITQDTFILWDQCLLYDSLFNFITSYSNIRGDMTFTGLKAGTYNVAFSYGTHAAIKSVPLTTNQIATSASASTYYANVGETIYFYSQAKNASSYSWDFGDGTIITGIANPQLSYPAPGVYTVTLHCSNSFGCDSYQTLTVYIGQGASIVFTSEDMAGITVLDQKIIVQLKDISREPVLYQVYNLSGQQLAAGLISDKLSYLDLSTQPTGMYILRLQGDNGNLTRKIFLQ